MKCHCDSVLARGLDWRRHVLVALVEDTDGDRVLRELSPVTESILRNEPSDDRKL